MSNYEHKDGSGSLWVNDKKQAENQPDYIVEVGPTSKMFNNPDDSRTEDYVNGRFG